MFTGVQSFEALNLRLGAVGQTPNLANKYVWGNNRN